MVKVHSEKLQTSCSPKRFLPLIMNGKYVCDYPTPQPWARSSTRFFNQNKDTLNSEFFFSKTGCLTKAK